MNDTHHIENNKNELQDRMPSSPLRRGLLEYFVYHRTAVHLVFFITILCGIYAASNLRLQFIPDNPSDIIIISYEWKGSSAKDVDITVGQRITPLLLDLPNLDFIETIARDNNIKIIVKFQNDHNIATLLEDIKRRIGNVDDLNDDIKLKEVRIQEWREQVVDIIIYGDISLNILEKHAHNLTKTLQQNGVNNNVILTKRDKKINIELTQKTLLQHSMNLNDIANIIQSQMSSTPVGDVNRSDIRVRSGLDRQNIETLKNITIDADSNGQKIYLDEIANIYSNKEDSNITYTYNQQYNAIPIRISRHINDDTIDIYNKTRYIVDIFKKDLPENIDIKLIDNKAQSIIDRITLLLDNSVYGLAFVAITLFLFLSARTAFWVTAGLPTAISIALLTLYLLDFSLNMISLFAFIICIGIVVDDSIIVGEHTDFLYRKGISAHKAAIWGAKRMFNPVLAATLTTIITFVSLLLIGGDLGEVILIDLSLTVMLVLLASLFEAFIILPAHMRYALTKNHNKISLWDRPSNYCNKLFEKATDNIFMPVINFILNIKGIALSFMVMILSISISLILSNTVPWRYFDSPERGVINANIAMLDSATRQDTSKMLKELERALQQTNEYFYQKYNHKPVVGFLSVIGEYNISSIPGVSPFKDNELRAGINITLTDPNLRLFSASDFIKKWRTYIKINEYTQKIHILGESDIRQEESIKIFLYGADHNILKKASLDIQKELKHMDAVINVTDSSSYSENILSVNINELGQALNINQDDLSKEIYARLKKIQLTEFIDQDNDNIIIELGLTDKERQLDFLKNNYFVIGENNYVAISDITTSQKEKNIDTVLRSNNIPTIVISGDFDTNDAIKFNQLSDKVYNDILPRINKKYNTTNNVRGTVFEERKFFDSIFVSAIACVIFIYITLAWIFSSLILPILIMMIIPFGMIGMVVGHYIHDIPLGFFSVIGMIGMAGILVNDSIILVTTTLNFSKKMEFKHAIVEAIKNRIRPVFLTSITTILGLMPLFFEKNIQAQFILPTIITLVYGLTIGVLIVLVIVPASLLILDDIKITLYKLLKKCD